MSGLKLLCAVSTLAAVRATAATYRNIKQPSARFRQLPPNNVLQIRGGGDVAKKESKSSKKSVRTSKKTKTVIDEKMKEKDAASLMGDAIR